MHNYKVQKLTLQWLSATVPAEYDAGVWMTGMLIINGGGAWVGAHLSGKPCGKLRPQ